MKVIDKLKELINNIDPQEVPVACVITDNDNNIISTGINTRETLKNIAGHAEINAINKLLINNKIKTLKGLTLYTTLEPCLMCLGAIEHFGIDQVTYILDNIKYGAKDKSTNINFVKIDDENSFFSNNLKDFFRKMR